MISRAAMVLAALPLASHASGPAGEADALQLPLLPGIDRARVAIPEAAIDGHSVVVFEFHSQRAPRDALAEIERQWRAQGVETVLHAQTGDWFVLSRLAGSRRAPQATTEVDGFETLQLRASAGGGCEGLITHWTRARNPADGDSLARLVPDDAQVVRQLSSGAARGERRAATLVAHFAGSLDDAERRLERHLLRAGYEPMRGKERAHELRWRDDRARFYRGAHAELLVTLHRQPQGASAVLHYAEMPSP